ncbi:MAG: hypothetical protein COV74_05855 [Candidatus Omnitrophica bacterium CG11_big_fil_rev_8_21_14_0_20_45_26]|uniref:Peptidase M16 n=1 Tax=Candidatus Abzuiibacterium crystallinum TaxID=1974748 RepID=A0A2H0LP53_9BACT|nr:MAG: hypothetical protein COV74_05855 [Candidatus Omnitrophica bacterium CG11_big_fil_rev_8_21_14_0_20_45_26]PIW64093.1 MAG: hypothetical protein COW12_07590 [Candidatus Omnitrophica bacterium CG12_big_fil_rev_8_21_14_0_65_45_16]
MRSKLFLALPIFLLAVTGCQTHPIRSTNDFKLIREMNGIQEYQSTKNQLRILLVPKTHAPVTAVMATYFVGSRDETPGFRGSTHLLEHMLFKGTQHFNTENGKPMAQIIQGVGGILNASTYRDATSFYDVVPNDQLSIALQVEADRMRRALLTSSDLDAEIPVVSHELSLIENDAEAILEQKLWSEAFRGHHYEYPIIGNRDDIESATAESLRSFYDRFYWPNNAMLTIVGEIDTPAVLSLADQWFGGIAASPQAIHHRTVHSVEIHRNEKIIMKRADGENRVMMAHRIPAAKEPVLDDLYALTQILAEGQSSRLYQALVATGLATQTQAYLSPAKEGSLMITTAQCSKDILHEMVEAKIKAVYEDIRTKGVSAEEVKKAKNQLKTQAAFEKDGPYAALMAFGQAIAVGDWQLVDQFEKRIDALNRRTLQNAAKSFLSPSHAYIGYLIHTDQASNPPQPVPSAMQAEQTKTAPAHTALPVYQSVQPISSEPLSFLDQTVTQFIENAKIMSLKTQTPNAISIAGAMLSAGRNQADHSLAAAMTALLLTQQASGSQLKKTVSLLENLGAQLSYSVEPTFLSIKGQCLQRDIQAFLKELVRQLRTPDFDENVFERIRRQKLVELESLRQNPGYSAYSEWARYTFSPNHPDYEPPLDEQIAALKRLSLDDVRRFHHEHFGPNQFILVLAGDVDHNDVRHGLKKTLAGWDPVQIESSTTGSSHPDYQPSDQHLFVPDKTSVRFLTGLPLPLMSTDASFTAVQVINDVLGGSFSSRLAQQVREAEGLTYYIHSDLVGIRPDTTGALIIESDFNPEKVARGKEAIRTVLETLQANGVETDELQAKKNEMIGIHKIRFSHTRGMANRILESEILGLGLSYMAHLPEKINALSPAIINETIQTYLKPDQFFTVTAGSTESENGLDAALSVK